MLRVLFLGDSLLKSHNTSAALSWLTALGGIAPALSTNATTRTYNDDALGRCTHVDLVVAQLANDRKHAGYTRDGHDDGRPSGFNVTIQDLAWLPGMWDLEGCSIAARAQYPQGRPRAQKNEDPMETGNGTCAPVVIPVAGAMDARLMWTASLSRLSIQCLSRRSAAAGLSQERA